jgi:branched-chain amino acid transport system substrate-binding protein
MFFKFLNDMKAEKRSVNQVGIVWENSAYGTDAAKAERDFAGKYNYPVQVDIGYPAKTTNVSSEVQKLKSAAPEVLLANSYVSDAVLYMRGFKDANYAPAAILAQDSGYVDPQFVKILGPDAEYILSREVFAADGAAKKPLVKQVNDLFHERTGFDMNANSARAFQGVLVLAEAIDRAPSTKPEDLRKALSQIDVPADRLIMPWSGIRFNEKNKNSLGRGIIVQIQGGKYRTVWPADVATTPIVWPFPGWDKR